MGTKLELADLHHRFGATPVLGGLDLRLEAGEIGCLLGPSGCGKTTVLRLIAGLESVQRGEIRIDGTTVAAPGSDLAPEQRRVGMVFQDHALFPHLDVLGNVSFGLAHLPDARRREVARDYLARVGLDDAGDRYPHQLSGGQRQRVALARALAPEPRLILLDEPFASLDVELRERLGLEVRELLRSCQATALLVTHDQQEAFAIADRIGVLAHGRIHQWDLAYNLYHRPVDRFVADFVGQGVLLDGVVEADGSIRVELGRLPGQPITQFPPDSRVEVLLRPDDLIHDDASPLTARIVRKVFRGAEILYTLELPSRARVLSLVPSHHNHQVGEAIGIRLATDHVVAFARCD